MGKFIIVFLSFFFLSCTAQKADYAVVNDFLDVELSKMAHDTIFVIQQPLNNIETLKMYNQAFMEKNTLNASERSIWVYPELDLWPLNEKDINVLEVSVLKKTDLFWNSEDFKNKEFIILPENTLKNKDFINKHFVNNRIINISKPLYNKELTFALFRFYPSLLFGGAASDNNGLILMKKEKDKWVQVALFQYAVYH